ncbi:MAG: ABC transporter substrate-binding protein [Zoogloeaceae bacterium]|jgi:TRAP transporter TAXI family solute receptor|nr:ABC transporter substrate-binding protein [Zoogloeaceae bacterium]
MGARFQVWRENLAALASGWPLAGIVLLGFWFAFQFVKPAPPKQLVITAGKPDGAYHAFAERYREILARDGITLKILASGGSGENLRRLKAGQAQIGFVQGGMPPGKPGNVPLYSLGSAFYEPIWVFTRGEAPLSRLARLAGKRIAVAQESNSARALAYYLLEANGIDADDKAVVNRAEYDAAEALQQGRLDALFVVAAPESMVVRVLLRSPNVHLMRFSRAEAYRRRFPALSHLVMPEGGVDLARNIPDQDIPLVSATANLIVREDTHPALQTLMLAAMREVHGGKGYFQSPGEFPAYKDNTFPISAPAERFYASGPPFLQHYLPFWLAVLLDRFLILALPLFTLLVPIARLAPVFYNWRVRSRICRCYGELKFLENDIRCYHEARTETGALRAESYRELCKRLEGIEQMADDLAIPIRFADQRYTLREHIQLVRGSLLRAPGEETGT